MRVLVLPAPSASMAGYGRSPAAAALPDLRAFAKLCESLRVEGEALLDNVDIGEARRAFARSCGEVCE